MPLINEQISNLINGISQQPPSLRLASQSEVQENGMSTVAEGLKKRPPLEHISKLTSKTDTDAYVHYINRDASERYVLIISSEQFDAAFSSDFTGTELEVYDIDGSPVSVSGVTGKPLSYITTSNARDNLQLFSVADYTFILNKQKTVLKRTQSAFSLDFSEEFTSVGSVRAPEGIVFLKQATNAATMTVYVDGSLVSTVTSSTDAAVQIDDIYSDMNSAIGSTFTMTKFGGSNIHVTKDDGTDFTLHCNAPEDNLIGIKDSVPDFTDLPSRTKDGFTIKLTGDPSAGTDDYWIRHSNASDSDVGEWTETVGAGLPNSIDADTMPINLIRTIEDPFHSSLGTDFGEKRFTLSQIEWTDRAAGDEDTTPDPSFIGQKLNDMFFHKNRLGFLANENIILSELGRHYNYYATTATDLLDTDMIDLAAPSNKVSILHSAIPFNENLYIFSDFSQFKLSEFAAGGLTPTNAKISLLTEYEHDKTVTPVVNGRKIYFADENDGFSTIREFGIIEDLQEETAENITAHCPSYIKGRGFQIVPHDDFLFVLSDENVNEIFVYKFMFQEGAKKLSSWSKWTFKEEEQVIGMTIIDYIAYFVVVRPDGTYLDQMSLQDANLVGMTASSTQLPFKVHLDRLVEVTGTYNIGTDKTSWVIPYPDDFNSTFRVIYSAAWEGKEGGLVQGVSQITPRTLEATGDHSAYPVLIGKEYQFLYEFTEPTIKTDVAGRLSSLSGGILKIRKFNVDYFRAGYFEMKVTAPGRSPFSHIYTGRILGSALNKVGEVPFETGSFKKLILADARDLKIELLSDSYLPCAFTGADWEGNYVVRTVSRRA
tara:strand:+ start:17699 stop:20173 length:2475 start_codon:yes stop_codon:yes gene_type:complete